MTEERLTGGTCVNRGCLPSKNLIEAARLVHDAQRPRFPGLEPCRRPSGRHHCGEAFSRCRDHRQGRLGFTVLSDPQLQAARAFKLVLTVDAKTRRQYEQMFDLDLAQWNASGTWELPALGTFVIDSAGIIRFAHADWDYKVRADPDDVIAAVRNLAVDTSPARAR